MWLVAGIFPVFIAMILGYMMWIYRLVRSSACRSAWARWCVPIAAAACRVRRVSTRNLFIAICAASVVGLVCARLAFLAADLG